MYKKKRASFSGPKEFKAPVQQQHVSKAPSPSEPEKSTVEIMLKSPSKREVGTTKSTDLESLKSREKELDEEMETLEREGNRSELLQVYIDLLHEYNDVKDVAQTLMGHIAVLEGVTNREIALRFNAPASED